MAIKSRVLRVLFSIRGARRPGEERSVTPQVMLLPNQIFLRLARGEGRRREEGGGRCGRNLANENNKKNIVIK